MTDDFNSRLRAIFPAALNRNIDPASVVGDNLMDNLGINSVDALEVLIRIEGEFGIMIEDDDLSQDLVNSFDKLADYVRSKMVPK